MVVKHQPAINIYRSPQFCIFVSTQKDNNFRLRDNINSRCQVRDFENMKCAVVLLSLTAGVCHGAAIVGEYGDGNVVNSDDSATVVGGDENSVCS